MRKLIAFAVVAAGAAALITIPAAAKPPTGNGRIVFTRFDPVQGDDFVYTANPDGSQEQQLLPTGAEGRRRRFRTDRQSGRRELPGPGKSRPRPVLPALQRALVA